MSWYGEVGTGSGPSGTYWYVLVHTSTYWYVQVRTVCNGIYYHVYLYIPVRTYWYVQVRTVYNGIYYHVYLWVHAMKAPLWHLERVASGTH